MKTLSAKYIVPIVGKPIKNGVIEYDDNGVITSISENHCYREDLNYYDGIVCPGFVNAHCHIELSHLQGVLKQGTGMDGFIKQINALRDGTDRQKRIELLIQWMDRLYNQGVSAMGDISNSDESFDYKSISLMFTRTFLEVFGTEAKDADDVMNNVLELQKLALSKGILAAPTPHSCYTTSPQLIQKVAQAGMQSGYISYHSQESPQEEDMIRYGKGELSDDYHQRGCSVPELNSDGALCYFLDILQKIHPAPIEENVLLVHNVTTDKASIDMAKSVLKNPYWVVCPMSNIFIHRTLPNIPLFVAENLNICVGTDSLSSNVTLCMIDEIKCLQDNFSELTLPQILSWATLNGAKAIGCDSKYGSIEIGKAPGLVFIDHISDDMKLTEQSQSVRII